MELSSAGEPTFNYVALSYRSMMYDICESNGKENEPMIPLKSIYFLNPLSLLLSLLFLPFSPFYHSFTHSKKSSSSKDMIDDFTIS